MELRWKPFARSATAADAQKLAGHSRSGIHCLSSPRGSSAKKLPRSLIVTELHKKQAETQKNLVTRAGTFVFIFPQFQA